MIFRPLRGGLWLLPLLVLGCDDGDLTLPEGDARLSLLLTDAPGDVEAVWVDILEIYLQGGGQDDAPRVVLLDEPTGLVELTSLQSTAAQLVQDAAVDAGSYAQLRAVIGGAVLETKSGSVFSKDGAEHPLGLETTGVLHCPSCSTSGIKVKLSDGGLAVQEGDNTVVLDFDVSQTFGKEAGNSGRWIMKPVIHASKVEGPEADIRGSVALADGTVVPECPAGTPRSIEDFIPTATAATLVDGDGMPIVRSGTTDTDGSFRIRYLDPDDYALGYLDQVVLTGGTLSFTADVDPAAVTVAEGESVKGVVYTVTGVTCTTP